MRANEVGQLVREYYLYCTFGYTLLHLPEFFQLNYNTRVMQPNLVYFKSSLTSVSLSVFFSTFISFPISFLFFFLFFVAGHAVA
jgi:hypothetical protein